MTFAIGHIAGGTNAGHKKPMRTEPSPWIHVCKHAPLDGGVLLPGYRVACECGARRDGFAEASVVAEQFYAQRYQVLLDDLAATRP